MVKLKFLIKLSLISVILCVVMLSICGCSESVTQVENLMKITNDFVGERIVTINLGTDFDTEGENAKNIDKLIKESCPPNMSYRQENQSDGYKYIFVISFSSLNEYKAKVASVIGRKISVAYGYTNSVLSKGTYYREDYDGMELVSWIKSNLEKKGYKCTIPEMQSTSNVVNYNSEVFSSKTSVMDTSTVQGEPVHSVTIYTVNHKNSLYDRTMVISLPKTTYSKLGTKLEELMKSRVGENSKRSGWTDNGSYVEFSVKYEKIDIASLQEYTKLFLDCYNEDIYYGDQNQSSTMLAEQLVFEENINVLSMVSDKDEGNVQINYNYTLPNETTHGEGAELKDGEWATLGSWTNNTYTFIDTTGVHDIRVPDGMQYTIKGIDITLTLLDIDSYKRVVDLIYDKKNGENGMNYAYGFLANKGVTVSKESSNDGTICRIIHQGSSEEIGKEISELFGSGNYFNSYNHTDDLSVVTNISFNDNININYMLTGANSNIKIKYSALSENDKYIRSLGVTGLSENTKASSKIENRVYTSTVVGGNLSVEGSATSPNTSGIILYCSICGVIIIITFAVILLCVKYNRKLILKEIIQSNKDTKQEIEELDSVRKHKKREEKYDKKTNKTDYEKNDLKDLSSINKKLDDDLDEYDKFLRDFYNME